MYYKENMAAITELLNKEKISSGLNLSHQRQNLPLIIFDSIDSTNNYLLGLIKSDAPSGTACFAEQQTAGRGRRGREWVSPPGSNIYCSLLWRFPSLDHLSGLNIAVAAMIAEVLAKSGVSGIQLKWPNDVLREQRKLAGVLLEGNGQGAVVIGIGLNLYAPEGSSWGGVNETVSVTRNVLAGLLLDTLLTSLPRFAEAGAAPWLDAWRSYDCLLDKPVSVLLPNETVSGVMRGVDAKGRMQVLKQDGGVEWFSYGEVSVRVNL